MLLQPKGEWRLDKAQQNGAFLRKWLQMLVGGSRKPGSIPCKPWFPRAGWGVTGGEKDQGGIRPPQGHPEATLRPSGGQLYSDNYFWRLVTIINLRKSHLSFLTQPQLKLS